MGVLVALDAVFVAEKVFELDGLAAGRLDERGTEPVDARGRGATRPRTSVPWARARPRPRTRDRGRQSSHRPRNAAPPAEPGAHQAMKHEEPDRDERTHRMDPEEDGAGRGVVDAESDATDLDPNEEQAGQEEGHADPEECPADRDGSTIRPESAPPRVTDPVDDEGDEEEEPEDELGEEGPQIRLVLAGLTGPPGREIDRDEVQAVQQQEAEQHEDDAEPDPQSTGHHGPLRAATRSRRSRGSRGVAVSDLGRLAHGSGFHHNHRQPRPHSSIILLETPQRVSGEPP